MLNRSNPNIDLLEKTISELGDWIDQMVLLGGCATGLLITDPASPPIRATLDVDMIVEVISLTDYYHLSDQLRQAGFHEDQATDAPYAVGEKVIFCWMSCRRIPKFWVLAAHGTHPLLKWTRLLNCPLANRSA